MKYLTGKDRNQLPLFVGSLEEAIEADNEVKLLEAFVDMKPSHFQHIRKHPVTCISP